MPATRAPAQVPVEIVWARGARRVFRLSCEVGLDGVGLRFPAPFPEGEEVQVSFALPDATVPLAAVANIDETGTELRFAHLPAASREKLVEYARVQARRP